MQWLLLVVSSIFALLSLGNTFSNYPLIISSVLAQVANSFSTKTLSKFLVLYAVAYLVGTLAEAIGLKYGLIFGTYLYTIKETGIFNVPLQVSLYWANFYYVVHLVSNRFFSKYLYFTDALLMVGIDLLLDPVMVRHGAWKWIGGGVYFGIPPQNFVGWFMYSLIISVIVRRVFKIKIYDQNKFGLVSFVMIFMYMIIQLL